MNRLALVFLFAVLVAGCVTAPPKNPWLEVKAPTRVETARDARAIGGYSAGCLSGAASLAPDGLGYEIMRPTRRRFYGHPHLVSFIQRLGARVAQQKLGTLLIGDMALPRGGPTSSNHMSHQTGLDVDIWYWRLPEEEKRSLTFDERETLSAPSVLSKDRETVDSADWNDANIQVLKAAAEDEEVERIFVNPVIKRELCINVPKKDGRWMRKLRPWYGHDDHFHVRLRCPARPTGQSAEGGCAAQEPVPSGDGCDETLNWWFSEEARAKAKAQAEAPIPPLPKLPEACEAVLRSP